MIPARTGPRRRYSCEVALQLYLVFGKGALQVENTSLPERADNS